MDSGNPPGREQIASAGKLVGLEFTEEECAAMAGLLGERVGQFAELRAGPFARLANHDAPPLYFNPQLPQRHSVANIERSYTLEDLPAPERPDGLESLAFWPVTHLAGLLRSGRVSSLELTEMYLARLKRYGPQLECVVTLTEELALEQARRADRELARGIWRGSLHGIPWGAKDLLATKGYPTTWGARPWREQRLEVDATVVQRLEEAGAVLVAKLTLGALASGDHWFGGMTRNPWKLDEGSSGSSAGSASATAAGLVGFSLGSETMGSIISPATRCGATGLRPTFGRVSRHGAMTLSWTMDKLGPICRSVGDCAQVLAAIHGPDGSDGTVTAAPFHWQPRRGLDGLRIGFVAAAFAAEADEADGGQGARQNERATLDTLRSLNARLLPVSLPPGDLEALSIVYLAEAAAAFDEMTRLNLDDQLRCQDETAWPNLLRAARFIPAVEYLQANRYRMTLMQQMDALFQEIDVLVTPSFAGNVLQLTNLTGHPAVALPNGFSEQGTPTSISFVGGLNREAELLAVAEAFQDATDFHRRHPPLFDDDCHV